MAMALRVARYVAHRLKGGKLGFLGSVSSGCNPSGHDYSYPSSICWHRHYFLPSPPAVRILNFPTNAGVRYVEDAEYNVRVRRSAEFAVKAHNEKEDNIDGGGEIKFGRVLRASARRLVGITYYITLEALSGKADINVYYAEVLDRPDQNLMKLIRWELVNESFSYPFEELRLSDCLQRKYRRERVSAKNFLISAWFEEMDLICRNPEPTKWISPEGNIDFVNLLTQNPIVGMPDRCPATLPESLIDLCPTIIRNMVQVYDIKTYEMVYEYAMFAVETWNKNEDEQVILEEVLWASKSKVNKSWIYRMVLEATNEQKELVFYYTIVTACPTRHLELIKWHQIPTAYPPDEKEVVDKQLDLGSAHHRTPATADVSSHP